MAYWSHLLELNDNPSQCLPFFLCRSCYWDGKDCCREGLLSRLQEVQTRSLETLFFPPDPFTDINDEAALSVSLPWLAMP